MYWVIGILVYITIGCNIAYWSSEDDLGIVVVIIIWPLLACGISLYFIYKVLTLPSMLIKSYVDAKKNEKRFWKWKKAGYDQELNNIVRLK